MGFRVLGSRFRVWGLGFTSATTRVAAHSAERSFLVADSSVLPPTDSTSMSPTNPN